MISAETSKIKTLIYDRLLRFGHIQSVSVNGLKKTAIIKFRFIESAEACYKESREFSLNDEGMKLRKSLLGDTQKHA